MGFEIGKDGLSAIVVGYDGTETARGALAFAFGLARREDAYLHVCFVGSMPATTAMAAAAAGAVANAVADEYGEICGVVSRGLSELGVRGECIRRDGDAARVLDQLAEEVRADLIVVGRSRSRAHAVIGSVAVTLVKRAGRPVVVVP